MIVKPGQSGPKRDGPDCAKCGGEMWVLDTSVPKGTITFRCSVIGCGHTEERSIREARK